MESMCDCCLINNNFCEKVRKDNVNVSNLPKCFFKIQTDVEILTEWYQIDSNGVPLRVLKTAPAILWKFVLIEDSITIKC